MFFSDSKQTLFLEERRKKRIVPMTRGSSTLFLGSLGFRIFGGGLSLAFCSERSVMQKRGSTGLKFGYPNNDKPFQKNQTNPRLMFLHDLYTKNTLFTDGLLSEKYR
jgi:hypothetical protein